MDNELTIKIIALVQQYRCIYSKNDKKYNNIAYKNVVWEHIGKQLNIEGYTARRQWRALREGYMRYKRALKHHNNWQPYYWSKYLAFLDEGNVLSTRSLGNDTSSSGTWNSFYYSPETLIEISNSSEIQVTDSLVLVPDMSSRNTEIGRTSRTMSTMGKYDKHKRREMSHFDSVDYLFLSYANTFKRMPMTQQVHLKVEMAKLFANAELDFMND